MIRALFARLSQPSQHGALVVSRALAYLAAARYGLSDEEMLALLWRDPDVRKDFEAQETSRDSGEGSGPSTGYLVAAVLRPRTVPRPARRHSAFGW